MSYWETHEPKLPPLGNFADPYFDWVSATGFTFYGQTDWLPLLIEVKQTAAEFASFVLGQQALGPRGQTWAKELRIPAAYRDPALHLREGKFLVIFMTRTYLAALSNGSANSESDKALVGRINRFELGFAIKSPVAVSSKDVLPATLNAWTEAKPNVITGVIDDGIAFAHDRFFSSDDATRIEYLWVQPEPSAPANAWVIGRELVKRDSSAGIDQQLNGGKYGVPIDEDQVYRHFGLLDRTLPGHKPLAARFSHGTHVLDLACNLSSSRPSPGAWPIIAVQLPSATVEDTSGASLGANVLLGLLYILIKAEAIAQHANSAPLPVVVNVSYGRIAGPHDGSSLFEATLDEFLKQCNPVGSDGKPTRPPFRVVLPAGNNYLSRCHARFSLGVWQTRELVWRVLPDDRTESYLEIWLPIPSHDVKINITAPDGTTTLSFGTEVTKEYIYRGKRVGKVSYYPAGLAGKRARVTLFLTPTGSAEDLSLLPPIGSPPHPAGLAPAGLWRVKLLNMGQTAVQDIHAWIQRDDTAPGYPTRGRQSYFDDPAYQRYDDGGRAIEDDTEIRTSSSYVKRKGTLNALATGTEPIVIGGFRRSDGALAPYSASGPLVDSPPGRGAPSPDGPDAMLPSEDSPSHRGVLAAGTRSNSCVAMHGTSVAAPKAALQIAEWMAAKLSNGRQAIFDMAAKIEQGKTDSPDQERGGGGRIDLPSNRRAR